MNPTLMISKLEDGPLGVLFLANRKKYFEKIGVKENEIVNMHLSHGKVVTRVSEKDGGKLFENTDGLITNSDKIHLALLVGDCLPISLFDPITNSIGLIHAGWKGLFIGVIKSALTEMSHEFGTKANDVTVFIGAHICQKHYEVKSDVSFKFKKYQKALRTKNGKTFLDLAEIAKLQLEKLGVRNIKVDSTCTFENKQLFSYRRGDKEGRNLYFLALRFH